MGFGSILTIFGAATDGPPVHIVPGVIFELGGLEVTNSMFYAVVCGIIILIMSLIVARRITVEPRRGLVQFYELGTEFITKLLTSSFGSEQKALKYAPYFVTIFFILLLSNWLGLMPGVGEAVVVGDEPLFRPFTADLNGTLAAATVSIILVQVFAIKESGFIKHLSHYFDGSLKNPITLFLGVFEMLTEFVRIASLALRLFLVITIGEVIIAVFAYLGGVVAPIVALPFLALELGVGALQAYIFVTLSVMYLSIAIKHGHENDHVVDKKDIPELEAIHKISTT
jgi:F-type H+-transporting ATPase subunit a